MKITIMPAQAVHAPLIAQAITMAIGDELVANLAGHNHTAEDVHMLFETLARRTDTQYSYRNTLIAVTENGDIAGLIVCYNGADLYKLRPIFFEKAEQLIGLKLEGEPTDETGPEEFYLDTLAVFPEYRGQGIASKLLMAAYQKAQSINKPAGLLVSKENHRARRLYESLGFVEIGERPFAGEMMDHLIKE